MKLVETPLCSLCNNFTESATYFFPNALQPKLSGADHDLLIFCMIKETVQLCQTLIILIKRSG